MSEPSKFVAFLDTTATPVNRRPNLKGEYRLAGEATTYKLALWGGVSDKTKKLYARGTATPEGVSAAIRAIAPAETVIGPKGVDLNVGEAVLFENPDATADNKQPKFRGYAREADRFVRLAGWERGNMIAGSVEPYRPAVTGNDNDAPTAEHG